MSLDDLKSKRSRLNTNLDSTITNMDRIITETQRVADVALNSKEILVDLDLEFEEKTGLKGQDIAFLFLATGLQVLRIAIINELTKIEPAGGKNKIEKDLHETQKKIMSIFNADSSVVSAPYYASKNQIISTKGVPYDATETLTLKAIEEKLKKNNNMSWDFDLTEYINDRKLPIFRGANHRFSTLGHDPIIGLFFGTFNIMTNTITCVKSPIDIAGLELPVLTTNHVIYTSENKSPTIGVYGSTTIMIEKAIERMIDEPTVFIASFIKQILHIGTDLFTTAGIQIPGANLVLSNTNVEKLTNNVIADNVGIDFGSILKIQTSAKIAELINLLISSLHAVMHDYSDGIAPELYSVKTRKIVLYSNTIATGSNVLWTGINVFAGDKTQIKNFDIGGIMVILKRLTSDKEYIRKIKEEFVLGGFKEMIRGEDLELIEPVWE